MDAAIIEKEALMLPEGQRAVLADRLLESLYPVSSGLQATWIRELDSRMDAFRAGEIPAIDGPEAMIELRSKFSR